MKPLKLISYSPEQTELLGSYLGKLACEGDVFLLVGDLGTGKTRLVQGIALGLHTTEFALSPSFVIVREYHGRLSLYHIDLYRLDNLKEVSDLGIEDYLYNEGVSVVEWADKGLDILPSERMFITLNYVPASEMQRVIYLKPEGERYLNLLKCLESMLNMEKVWS
jgi:tRNA threonylcarbamoyladenosine biosynthesis protein TsaE